LEHPCCILTAAAEEGAKVSDKANVLADKAQSSPVLKARLEQL
jgi:hypothetical protein